MLHFLLFILLRRLVSLRLNKLGRVSVILFLHPGTMLRVGFRNRRLVEGVGHLGGLDLRMLDPVPTGALVVRVGCPRKGTK